MRASWLIFAVVDSARLDGVAPNKMLPRTAFLRENAAAEVRRDDGSRNTDRDMSRMCRRREEGLEEA